MIPWNKWIFYMERVFSLWEVKTDFIGNLSKLENVLPPFQQNSWNINTKHFEKVSEFSIMTNFLASTDF